LQEFVLPSHLSNNNLPAIHKDIDVIYRLYTTETDYKALTEEAPRLLARLGEFASIEMVRLPDEVSFEYEDSTQETPTTKNIRAMKRFDHTKFNLKSLCYLDSIEKQEHIGRTISHCNERNTSPAVINEMAIERLRMRPA
jgi:SNF2 family DNA or RNA helicase